jgi:hypothetical protein
MGPSILDPRSGEILEADIMWWHNVISMVQEWITVQTGAIDPKARGTKLPDEMMGGNTSRGFRERKLFKVFGSLPILMPTQNMSPQRA